MQAVLQALPARPRSWAGHRDCCAVQPHHLWLAHGVCEGQRHWGAAGAGLQQLRTNLGGMQLPEDDTVDQVCELAESMRALAWAFAAAAVLRAGPVHNTYNCPAVLVSPKTGLTVVAKK